MIKFTLNEDNTPDSEYTINIIDHPLVQKANNIIKSHGFYGIEVAVFSNSYTNINGGSPDIFIDIDAYSYGGFYCVDYNTKASRFELRSSYSHKYAAFGPFDPDAEALISDLRSLLDVVNELSKLDFKQLRTDLIKEHSK